MYLTPSLFKGHHYFLGQFFALTVQKIGYGLVRKAVGFYRGRVPPFHLWRYDADHQAYIPESSFPNITKEILYRIADGRAVFEGKCEDVCTYRLDSAFGKAVVSTNSKGCISKISVDGEDYEMVLSDVKDANG